MYKESLGSFQRISCHIMCHIPQGITAAQTWYKMMKMRFIIPQLDKLCIDILR